MSSEYVSRKEELRKTICEVDQSLFQCLTCPTTLVRSMDTAGTTPVVTLSALSCIAKLPVKSFFEHINIVNLRYPQSAVELCSAVAFCLNSNGSDVGVEGDGGDSDSDDLFLGSFDPDRAFCEKALAGQSADAVACAARVAGSVHVCHVGVGQCR